MKVYVKKAKDVVMIDDVSYTVYDVISIEDDDTDDTIVNVIDKRAYHRHGESRSKLYGVWAAMLSRCHNPNTCNYKYYGGRGIKVCPDWYSYEDFRNWAIDAGYADGLSIDRINGNGDYTPDNCRWSTWQQQAENRRNNRYIRLGNTKKTISEWSRETGIEQSLLFRRWQKFGAEDISNLFKPVKSYRKHDAA